MARRIFDASKRGKPLRGLGQSATLRRFDSTQAKDGYDNADRTVTVVDDKLVVRVEYQRWGPGLGDDVASRAIAIARKVLRSPGTRNAPRRINVAGRP